MHLSSWFLLKPKTCFRRHPACTFSFHDKTFGSCHVNILIFSIEECRLYIMILKNPHMRKHLIMTYFFSLYEAFQHKSCFMLVLIASRVTYNFADPSWSTVLTPLAISSKSQNNIGTDSSYFILQEFLLDSSTGKSVVLSHTRQW